MRVTHQYSLSCAQVLESLREQLQLITDMEAQLEEQAEDGASGDGGSQKALREYLDKVGVVPMPCLQ